MLSVLRLKPEKNLPMSSAVALNGSPFIFTTLPSSGSATGDDGGMGAASPEPLQLLLLSSLARVAAIAAGVRGRGGRRRCRCCVGVAVRGCRLLVQAAGGRSGEGGGDQTRSKNTRDDKRAGDAAISGDTTFECAGIGRWWRCEYPGARRSSVAKSDPADFGGLPEPMN
jgi:hypothetical protein